MGFQNQFATAVLPARLDLSRSADIVEGARALCEHLAMIEARAAVVSSPALRHAYASYRRALTQFAFIAARTSPIVEAVAALVTFGGPHDMRRVDGVLAAAVELLVCLDQGRGPAPGRERALVRAGLLDILDELDQAAAVALLCQGFDQASRIAEVFQFPNGVANRGGNDG